MRIGIGSGIGVGDESKSVAGFGIISGPTPTPSNVADYVVANDAEWDALFAQTPAEILDGNSGAIIEIQGDNFTPRTIANKAFSSAGDAITLRSADTNAKLPHLRFQGLVTGVHCVGLNVQVLGWPRQSSDCVFFTTGNFDNILLKNCHFRHGYGGSQVAIDPTAQLPEYARPNNVQTATTTPTTHNLTWTDTSADDGEVYLFNRELEDVTVTFPGSNITEVCPAEELTRINGLDPSVDSTFTISTASGTSEVNARAEIGLSYYLAGGIGGGGGAVVGSLRIEGCLFEDLSDAIKAPINPDLYVIDRNTFRRIYQDLINFSPAPDTGRAWITRNIGCIPFSRAGKDEGQNGDARDPHGDFGQVQSDGSGVIEQIRTGGNYIVYHAVRPDVTAQGFFLSDNDNDPSFNNSINVADMMTGGSTRGIDSGESGYSMGDGLVYACTVVNPRDLVGGNSHIGFNTDGGYSLSAINSIAHNFNEPDQSWDRFNCLAISDEDNPAAIFPNAANFLTATNRIEVAAAMTPVGAGVGLGAVAAWAAGVIDFDPAVAAENCIDWSLVPSGPIWPDLDNQAVSAMVEFPPRRIVNPRPSQTVVVGTGVEWRSTAADGATEVQAWTSAAGTIEPGQMIQLRATTAATGTTDTVLDYTLNGMAHSVTIRTALAISEFLEVDTAPSYFVDPVNVPSGTRRIHFKGKFYVPANANWYLFAQESTGCDLRAVSNGDLRLSVEVSGGAKVVDIMDVGLSVPLNQWFEADFDANYDDEEAILSINGQTVTFSFTGSGAAGPQTNRELSFLASSGGGTDAPSGIRCADLEVYLNGALHKAIDNDKAVANVDVWHRGSAFIGS